MMSDWWTLGLKKKESHHLEIIHTNASVHAVFSQSSPLDLKTTSISFHWLLRTEEPVLIQGRGGGGASTSEGVSILCIVYESFDTFALNPHPYVFGTWHSYSK